MDRRHKLILKVKVGDANEACTLYLVGMLDQENSSRDFWTNCSYHNKRRERWLKQLGWRPHIQASQFIGERDKARNCRIVSPGAGGICVRQPALDGRQDRPCQRRLKTDPPWPSFAEGITERQFDECSNRVIGVADALVERNHQAGLLREGVTGEDIVRLVICLATLARPAPDGSVDGETSGDEEQGVAAHAAEYTSAWVRLLRIGMDGLRPVHGPLQPQLPASTWSRDTEPTG
ncbi:hypothetical protein [Azotobacter vinelandii]